jgi:hypothetical protein
MQHHPIAGHLRCAPVDERGKRIDCAAPFPVLPRPPAADSKSYRLAINPKLSGDAPGAFPALPTRSKFPYQILA